MGSLNELRRIVLKHAPPKEFTNCTEEGRSKGDTSLVKDAPGVGVQYQARSANTKHEKHGASAEEGAPDLCISSVLPTDAHSDSASDADDFGLDVMNDLQNGQQ